MIGRQVAVMIDKSKQLIIRVDLYFGYILIAAIFISICEIPLLAIRVGAARYLLPIGWLALLFFATARMWKAKIEHDLTSELQVYKMILGCVIIVMCTSFAYGIITNLEAAQINRFSLVAELVFVLNAIIAFDVVAIGILGIYLFDRIQALTRGTWL
jgi:hypothetical protein